MKNKQKDTGGFSAFIAALCIVVYLFALVQAVVRSYLSIDRFKITAGQEFIRVKNQALSAGENGFMNERFIEIMNNALVSSKALEALIITGPEGEYAFERQKGRAITWVNNSPRFINRITFSSQPYYDPLRIGNLRNANITAIASILDYNEISKILRETLALILIGFAVSFFTMLLQLLLGKSAGRAPGGFTYAQPPTARQPPPAPPVQTYAPVHAPVQDYSPSPQSVPQYIQAKRNRSPVAGLEPKGLYSARSNIGWEEYTNDRLDAELHRCASTEKDLTLVIIDFANAVNDDLYKKTAEEASSILSTKDMLFEYGDYGICALLPGADLNAGIGKAEKLYQRMMEKYSVSELSIGLSSRSGRLINADRLMLEGKEALNKAKTDPESAIIAFKSDPDKYRAYISQQN